MLLEMAKCYFDFKWQVMFRNITHNKLCFWYFHICEQIFKVIILVEIVS